MFRNSPSWHSIGGCLGGQILHSCSTVSDRDLNIWYVHFHAQTPNVFDLIACLSFAGDLTSFVANNEWEVVSLRSERNLQYYNCCPEPYPDVTFHLLMKRKPKFYVLTIIFPCAVVLALAALGFILPADSGEKVSLEVTVLLSLSVFLLLVSDKLPASAETFPIIGGSFHSMGSYHFTCVLKFELYF